MKTAPSSRQPPLLARVHHAVAAAVGPVAVACSGGRDSVALAHLVARARRKGEPPGLRLLHVDHGLRGAEGRADAAFVRELAAELGGRAHVARLDLGPGPVSENTAREARYAALVRLAREAGTRTLFTAHTRDDQEETIAFRVLRRAGPRGLAGMPRRRALAPGLVLERPLLDTGRDELGSWLAARGRPHREDRTNAQLRFTRNRLRHLLLPRLRTRPVPPDWLELGRRAAAIDAELADLLDAFEAERLLSVGPDLVRVVAPFSCPPALRFGLFGRATAALEGPAFGRAAERALAPLDAGVREAHLPGEIVALRAGDDVWLQTPHRSRATAPERLPPPGPARPWIPLGGRIRLGAEGAAPPGSTVFTCPLPASTRALRPPRAGDRLPNDRRSLLERLAREGLPRPLRHRWPVLVDAADRALAVPMATSDHPATRDAPELRLEGVGWWPR